jgi:hypothetical protein
MADCFTVDKSAQFMTHIYKRNVDIIICFKILKFPFAALSLISKSKYNAGTDFQRLVNEK